MDSTPRKATRLSLAAAAVASLTFAAAASLLTAGTASAPEPARLTQDMWYSTAPAVYTTSYTSTTVVKWPATWTAGSVAGGTPCSPSGLAEGQTTDMVIHVYNSYRKCM